MLLRMKKCRDILRNNEEVPCWELVVMEAGPEYRRAMIAPSEVHQKDNLLSVLVQTGTHSGCFGYFTYSINLAAASEVLVNLLVRFRRCASLKSNLSVLCIKSSRIYRSDSLQSVMWHHEVQLKIGSSSVL